MEKEEAWRLRYLLSFYPEASQEEAEEDFKRGDALGLIAMAPSEGQRNSTSLLRS